MRSISASATIRAPLSEVWAILADTARYPEWSPFVVGIEGRIEVGETVTLIVAMHPGRAPIRQREKISMWDEGREIRWGVVMGHRVLLEAERYQRLTRISESETLYETSDGFSGALVPIVFALYRDKIQAGFDATARALKARAETQGTPRTESVPQ
ncbi:MAG: SRPBCC domain-containing protein [Polyangiaceae bacterium]|nr:SRPBCC domain-containing protein [Polyangiaceae bacterium]